MPDEITTAYADEIAMDAGIETWTSYEKIVPEAVFKIYPRRADYDATEHVNNTRYCEYVLNAVARLSGDLLHPKEIRFQFNKEIGRQVDCLQIGLQRNSLGVSFVVTQGAVVFARGEVS